jgi:hypothetical protein
VSLLVDLLVDSTDSFGIDPIVTWTVSRVQLTQTRAV